MSPIVKKKREREKLPTVYWLLILSAICGILMILSFTTDIVFTPLNYIGGYVVVPFQKGLTNVGTGILDHTENLKKLEEVIAQNEELQKKIDELTTENTLLQQDKYELAKLRELYELDAEYEEYNKIGARIISREGDNWYSNFVIDKGTNDGIMIDCNVIAGSGLVGRVIDVGPDYAKVVSIISDNVNTSSMILSTGDTLMATGSLESMKKNGVISYAQLDDVDDVVGVGDKVVTSNISDKYLQGILVGYIDTINIDSNNLTKSGTIVPAVDFRHLEDVLVILEVKNVPEF